MLYQSKALLIQHPSSDTSPHLMLSNEVQGQAISTFPLENLFLMPTLRNITSCSICKSNICVVKTLLNVQARKPRSNPNQYNECSDPYPTKLSAGLASAHVCEYVFFWINDDGHNSFLLCEESLCTRKEMSDASINHISGTGKSESCHRIGTLRV